MLLQPARLAVEAEIGPMIIAIAHTFFFLFRPDTIAGPTSPYRPPPPWYIRPHYPSSVEVIGIDASLGMLRYARTEVDRLGKPAEVLQMDAEHLAFADRTFDSVAFNLCLCTIPNPERAIREAIRVARPGAPMIFLEHVRSHVLPVAVLQEVMNPVLVALQGDHFNRRTAEIVERSGVKVVSIDRWALGFFNLIAGQAP
mgnify:CR=1 FL=1